MSNNLTPYQIEAQQKYNNLSSPQKKSLKQLNKLKEKATGKQTAENDDTIFTKPDAVAAAADDYLNELIKKHQDQSAPLKTTQEFADEEQDEAGMIPVRDAWTRDAQSYQGRLNKFIEQAKAAKDRTGGKSRVFRKKSNKTKTKKVSRRSRRSRNIRRSRNSRAHERK
jgi:hypothetical protein